MVERKKSQFINEDTSINIGEYNSLFNKIGNSITENDLNKIATDYNLKLVDNKYPRLDFDISRVEIEELKNAGVLTTNNLDLLIINQDNLNPIAKLLFAIAWKQGDLQKMKQIIKGIEEVGSPDNEKKDALVFYCFGNHLGNPTKYPIIDQHVIRAFNLFKDKLNCDSVRRSDKVTQCDRKNYLEWFWKFENKSSGFLYNLDRILFEIGKTVKLRKGQRGFDKKITIDPPYL